MIKKLSNRQVVILTFLMIVGFSFSFFYAIVVLQRGFNIYGFFICSCNVIVQPEPEHFALPNLPADVAIVYDREYLRGIHNYVMDFSKYDYEQRTQIIRSGLESQGWKFRCDNNFCQCDIENGLCDYIITTSESTGFTEIYAKTNSSGFVVDKVQVDYVGGYVYIYH